MKRLEELFRKTNRATAKLYRKNDLIDLQGFKSYYRTILKEIDSHISYEGEMQRKQNTPAESIVRFQAADYLDKLHKWYSANRYYRFGFSDQVKDLVSAMLLEDYSVYENMPRKTLSRLVLGLVVSISSNCRLSMPEMIKEFYLYLKDSSNFASEDQRLQAHQVFDEMMALNDRDDISRREKVEEDKVQTMEGVLHSAGVVDARTARRTIRIGNPLLFTLRLAALAIIMTGATLFLVPELAAVVRIDSIPPGYVIPAFNLGVGILFLFFGYMITIRFSHYRSRIVIIRRSLKKIRRTLTVSDTLYRTAIQQEYSDRL